MYDRKTICAIATATGGALGIIRISGKDSIEIADKIFLPSGKNKKSVDKKTGIHRRVR